MVKLNRVQKRKLGAVILFVAFASISVYILTNLGRRTDRGSMPVIGGSLVVQLPAEGLGVSSAPPGSEIAFRFTKSNLAHFGVYDDAILWTKSEWDIDASVVMPRESDGGGQPLSEAEVERLLALRPPALRAAIEDRESAAASYDHTGRWGTYFREYSRLVDSGSSRLTGGACHWNNIEITMVRFMRTQSFGAFGCAIAAIGAALFIKNAPPRAKRLRFDCEACGYDLRATPPDKPCPECGHELSTGGASA